ncbi:Protein ERGIC-53 [Amphibalanus amphitrite]|uniref:Protein ERGIC-53 n=1 Tax=Amphibalanus amphitrite TaxID=1232801 RepID=A0A6A4WG60_AMPAM|nr:Protein ERGIC-53 [Amphibalanus amphitrite]
MFFISIVICTVFSVQAQGVYKRFEYKYGFKPPYLAQKDGTVPFWEHKGNTIASPDNVRVTPSLKSQKGMIWNKNQVTFKWWEVEMWFRITGRGRIGADGLAMWYTTERMEEGPVFGSRDKWHGLGVFFDSFDNDNKRNNPYVSAMVNDGTITYDHEKDGQGQIVGGCLRDFRNKPHPVRVRVTYLNNVLTLEMHNGITNSDKDFELCFRAENVVLPENGYFGLSAATGGLADDHDVIKFLTSSLATSPQDIKDERISEQERQRLKKEFEEYQQKTEQAKADYRREHPDAKHDDEDEEYDSEATRELRQIFDGQSQIYETVRELHRKMDEIVGRQERTLSLLSQQSGGGQAPPPPAPGQPHLPAPADTIRRHEVDAVLNNQREIVQASREIKSFVGEINQRTHTILEHQQRPVGSVQQTGGAGGRLQNVPQGVPSCPQTGGCLTLAVFLGVCALQMVIILGFLSYRDNKQAAAKKFY